MVDGSWVSAATWDGMVDGTVVISPCSAAVPADVVALADAIKAGYMDGSCSVCTGPILDQDLC